MKNEPTRGENSYNVVKGGWTGPNTILDGLTISGGNADGAGAQSVGGGILNDQNSPTMVNCTFMENYAYLDGGGIYNIISNMTLTNCTFIGNSSGGHSALGHGGGIGNFYATQTLNNCTFSRNAATWGSGVYSTGGDTFATNCTFSNNSASHGGGMLNSYGSLTITNCTFSSNSAIRGGGLSNHTGSNTMATNCTFSNNSVSEFGGGIFNFSSNSTFANCIVSGNSAASGGGIYSVGNPTFLNCTFNSNSAESGGGMSNQDSTPMVTNCIFWGNSASNGPEIFNTTSSVPTVTYSDIAGGHPGTGNIDEDPLFIGPNGLDGIADTADDEDDSVHLKGYSPCINAGDPSGDYNSQIDLDRQPRIAYGRVDMGVDEVFPVSGDFEPDGDVDFGDFAIYCNNWLLGVE